MNRAAYCIFTTLFALAFALSASAADEHEGHHPAPPAEATKQGPDTEQFAKMQAILQRLHSQLAKIEQATDQDERDWYTERHRRTVMEYLRLVAPDGKMGGKMTGGGMKKGGMGKMKGGMSCGMMGGKKSADAPTAKSDVAHDHSASSGTAKGKAGGMMCCCKRHQRAAASSADDSAAAEDHGAMEMASTAAAEQEAEVDAIEDTEDE